MRRAFYTIKLGIYEFGLSDGEIFERFVRPVNHEMRDGDYQGNNLLEATKCRGLEEVSSK